MEVWAALLTAGVVEAGYPEPVKEFKFHPTRKYRFDLCWPSSMVAFEREGGVWSGGRHVRGKGYESDAEKYSWAAIMGWCVVRASTRQIESGLALTLLLEALASRAKKKAK